MVTVSRKSDTLNFWLDYGPTAYLLNDLLMVQKQSFSLENLLPFAMGESKLARQVFESVLAVKEKLQRDPNQNAIQTCLAVTKWIHVTHQIEFESLEQESDTLAIVKGKVATSAKELLVTNTLKLLQTTYNNSAQLAEYHAVDESKLLSWHQQLMESVPASLPGQYRKSGVQASNTFHVYPHHQAVKLAIRQLCGTVYRLEKEIDLLTNDIFKLLYTFALAAFAQFHLVDVHPFLDGNGRMCRFLCKFILDSVLPLPFPMFSDRNQYITSLVDGRIVTPSFSPAKLFHLLLIECLKFYVGTTQHVQRQIKNVIAASTEQELMESVELMELRTKEDVLQKFREMVMGDEAEVMVDGVAYQLMRFLDIDSI